MYSRLQIINSMLKTTGLGVLAAEDIQHPSYAEASFKLDEVNKRVQGQGWWFNRYEVKLKSDQKEEIIVPQTALSARVLGTDRYVFRGNRLFDTYTQEYKIKETVTAEITYLIELEDLPPTAAEYIRAESRYEYFLDEDGDTVKIEAYAQERERAWILFKNENLKHLQMNILHTPARKWWMGGPGKQGIPY